MQSESLSVVALLCHIIIVFIVGYRVVMRRRPVGVSLAWLILVLAIPLAGVLLYLLIGEPPLGHFRARRARRLLGHYQKWLHCLPDSLRTQTQDLNQDQQALDRLSQHFFHIPAVAGNALSLFADADTILQTIAADIDQAQHHCYLEFYIWQPEGQVECVMQALIRATQRGVCCRIIVDAVGSRPFCRSPHYQHLLDEGIFIRQALPANPFRMLFRRIDLRLHRKLVVIDHHIAWTGSLNMVDPSHFNLNAQVGQWVDAMVRLEGAAALALEAMFIWDWERETGESLTMLSEPDVCQIPPPYQETLPPANVQLMPSGPGYHNGCINNILLTAIYGARTELIMTTPYFVPSESLHNALINAANRHVRVIIIVPEKVDSTLVRYASRAYYEDLLHAGVEIYRYTAGLLHTKSIAIDGETALFGTANLDMRSLWLNFEVTLCIYDKAFGKTLRELHLSYLSVSEPLNNEQWQRRSWGRKFLENSAQLLGPLL